MKARPAMARPPKSPAVSSPAQPSRRLHYKQPDVPGTGSASAASGPSSPIFVNRTGNPMTFYVPPSNQCGELRRLITAGGGKLAEKASKDVINVIPEGLQNKKVKKLEDAISSRFIVDCMDRKALLPLTDYRVGAGAAPAKAPAAAAAAAPMQRPAASPARAVHPKATREKFTKEEDEALLEWVKKNPELKSQGKDIWMRAVSAKVTGHSWQSMQNRYRRKLKEKKRDDFRKSLANGAAPKAAPAAARAPGAAAAGAAEEIDLIEDYSQPSTIAKRKAPEAEAESAYRPRWRKSLHIGSLSQWQLRKAKRGDKCDRREASQTQEVISPTCGGFAPAPSTPAAPAYRPPQLGNLQAQSRPVKRLMLDPFQGVPQWILDTQDLEKAADVSLLL